MSFEKIDVLENAIGINTTGSLMQKGDLKAQLHLEQWRYKGEPLQPECHWRERSPPWSNSSNDDCWRVSAADEGGLYSTLMQTSAIRDFGDKNAMFLQRVHPLGQYPDDSKMWLGQGEQYVLSPLGNIVDEQYTAYFEFVVPTSG